MFKTISRNIFVLCALSFTLSTINLSAQTKADEPSMGAALKKQVKLVPIKKLEFFKALLLKKL